MKMNPIEFDKYDKRCNVIKNLILKDYIALNEPNSRWKLKGF